MLSVLVVAVVASIAFAEDSHSEHDHGDGEQYEWAGIFETPNDAYTWTAQKVEGAYADASMKLVALAASSATADVLHNLEVEGLHSMGLVCINAKPGSVISPKEDACYNLQFGQDVWQSLFVINASETGAIAFFTEHFPTEFEATAHYLKDSVGDDVEPSAELPDGAVPQDTSDERQESKPWGGVIGASIIINVISLIGVISCVPIIAKWTASNKAPLDALVSGFAAGALLACSFFLLLFEATHLIATGFTEEVDILWRWGTMILTGFLLPGFVDLVVCGLVDASVPGAGAVCAEQEKEPEQVEGGAKLVARVRLIVGVLVGDFFHNLCDGFFVGAAFKGCGDSFGWGVALATVLHELPQEIADFAILTGPDVAMRPVLALASNFVSGLSVILGAIVVVATDVSDESVGLLLALGGGVYLHIGATECMPKIYNAKLSTPARVAAIIAFVAGAVVIGLVLLDHEHCVPSIPGSEPAAASGGHHH